MEYLREPLRTIARDGPARDLACNGLWRSWSGRHGGGPSLGATLDGAEEAEQDLVLRWVGGTAQPSSRVHLLLPAFFSNGYSVPMTLSIDSAMSEIDHVRRVHVLAPLNPIVPVATFQFTPQSGRAMVSTRIRLAEPQFVVAVAELSDGTFLKNRTWVKVETNGCN